MKKGFTFGYKKSLAPIEITPGPATYTLSSLQTSFEKPVFSMEKSKAPRFNKNNEEILGPGYYNPSLTSSKKYNLPSITKSLRSPVFATSCKGIPGPADYEIQNSFVDQNLKRIRQIKKPGYKEVNFKTAHNMKNQKQLTPGPGHYSVNESFFKSNHSIKINSASDQKNMPSFVPNIETPGPGQYSEERTLQQNGAPKFSFGTKIDRSFSLSEKKGPAPNSYNLNIKSLSGLRNKFFRDANYSFSKSPKKTKFILSENRYFPGPGTYNLTSRNPLLKENCMVFPSSIRTLYYVDSTTPGPGSYLSLPSLVRAKTNGYSQSLDIKNKKWKRRFKKQESYDSIEEAEKKAKEMKKIDFLQKMKENYPKIQNLESEKSITPKKINFVVNKKLHRLSGTPKNDGFANVDQNFGTPMHHALNDRKNSDTSFQGLARLRRMNSDSNIKTKHFQMNNFNKKNDFVIPAKPKQIVPTKSFSIGKSVRKLEYLDPGNVNPNIVRSPGPAGYNIDRVVEKKGVKIATSTRDDKFFILNSNPGVGKYAVLSSFVKKPKKKKRLNENLVKLLKRIELKVHPEKKREYKSLVPSQPKSLRRKVQEVIIKK